MRSQFEPDRGHHNNWPVAQLVECLTVNQDVAGSIPAWPAKHYGDVALEEVRNPHKVE